MGFYDREYYRREGSGWAGSFSDRGRVCKWLIAINVICFILQMVTQPRPGRAGTDFFTDALILNVDAVLHGQVWRLLTYAFLHETTIWQHIVFNMLFLWWFGSDVEDVYGSAEFLAFYLLSALLGGSAFVVTALAGLTGSGSCLGASGAVTAVMVLCALHYPSRVILLFFLIPVPIWLFVGFQVVQDAFVFISQQGTRTAVTVHLAGAVFAFGYFKRHWRVLRWWAEIQDFWRLRTRPRLRIYREEPRQAAPVLSPPEPEAENELESKLDAVLEKVARFGQKSLTDSERQILLRASEVYRKRRS